MTTRTFDKAPATLPLMLKAALPALPLVGALPGIKHTEEAAPTPVLRRPQVAVSGSHLDRYNEITGFAREPITPATYPGVNAFGLHMALMTDTSFPFAPMGVVHLRNQINQYRPIGREELIDLEVSAQDLRPHPKGRLIDIVTRATIGTETVWDATMTIFSRGSGGSAEVSIPPLDGLEAPAGTEEWKLAGNLGRRYGAISGDRNPIHLYPLTAKAFGFRRNIAHGMWTKARCLAALQNELPRAYRVEVEFQKPIFLPSTVAFGSEADANITVFGVIGVAKPVTHLVGRITELS